MVAYGLFATTARYRLWLLCQRAESNIPELADQCDPSHPGSRNDHRPDSPRGRPCSAELCGYWGGYRRQQIPHLFEPTFTRQGYKVKANLRLVAIYNIIQKHCGQISVECESGQASQFTLSLPFRLQMWPQIT